MGFGNTGISPSYKVPRYIAKIITAAGSVGAGSDRLRVLLVGTKSSAGTMVADSDVLKVSSTDDADAYAGVGSPLARQAAAALSIPSAEVYIAAATEPAGGTQATVTIVITGTWTDLGTIRFRLAGVSITCGVAASDSIDQVGANLAAAFNAKTNLPATAAYNSGTDTLTLTIRTKGADGKDWILYHDPTDKPAGMILTVTGSATVNTNGWRFGASSSGTGASDHTTILTKLQKQRYARIAVGQNDATNAALWETHVNTQAGPLKLLLEQLVFGHNGTLGQAISLAQTTLNAVRASVLWLRNGENHPAEIASLFAAVRSVTEQTDPVPDYDGYALSYLAAQAFDDDLPTDAEQDSALNAGVTPLTTVNGEVRCVRAITSYCLNGTAQDERCLDIGDIVMTDYATIDLKLMYETEVRPQNPYVGPDNPPELPPPAAGVLTPKFWASKVNERLFEYYANGWLEEAPVDTFAASAIYVKAGKYIAAETPLGVRRVLHRVDNVMRQISNSA